MIIYRCNYCGSEWKEKPLSSYEDWPDEEFVCAHCGDKNLETINVNVIDYYAKGKV